jgi:hypothetical protein
MRMKKIVMIAAVVIAAAACSKTFDTNLATEKAVGFSSWNDVMTKADKSAFEIGEKFEVFGYKHNGATDANTVFNAVEVEKTGASEWTYSPIRFWDNNFSDYTFFAIYPEDILATGDYAQNGGFTTNVLEYDGVNEVTLVAKKKHVEKGTGYPASVEMVFVHAASKVDIKVKKHNEIVDTKLTVNSIALNNIQEKGRMTVANYDDANGGKPSINWAPASPSQVNDAADAAYKKTTATVLDAGTGNTTDTAASLINGLIAMPQNFTAGVGAQSITISYTITTGTTGFEDSINYETTFEIGKFDSTDPNPDDKDNTTPFIGAWEAGVHYTYYITINANNKITFTASIEDWAEPVTGHHYIIK